MNVATLERLARCVDGEVVGNAALEIRGAASLDKAGPQEIAFAVNDRSFRSLVSSKAGACFVDRKDRGSEILKGAQAALVLVDDPLDAFVVVLKQFRPQSVRSSVGISSHARIDPTALIGPDCNIYAGAFIDAGVVIGSHCDIFPGVYVGRNCKIGDECVLHSNAVLYHEVVLGQRVVIHASAVVGADGFGYRFREGRFEKIPQLGWVEIQDDCEIGACATIDRGMIGPTVIGAGTKLDNLVMIGHNCELGRHNAFASQVGLAGSVTTGDYVRCAGQVGIADHVHLGTGSTLGAKAGVHKDIPAGETHIGAPARPEKEEFRIMMATAKVPEMRKQLRELEARINLLTQQLEHLTSTALDHG